MTYYNTTSEIGQNLANSWIKTAKQDEIILMIFARHKESIFTPHEIQSIARDDYDKLYPITSVRRSINTLTKREALEKTSIKRKGGWGKSNYCWKYAV
tara:strand:- start:1198 stop:1491 length:294 start_codon:yes stop_codon:yes gene_type:complete